MPMVYATYRRGYKSGGFNSGVYGRPTTRNSSRTNLTDVEIGTKNN